jgi:SET domain-containing protein
MMNVPEGLQLANVSMGIGVLATRPWKKGEFMGDYEGIEMLKTEFIERYGKDIRYTYWTNHNFAHTKVIVAKEKRNFITYINERKEPNVVLKSYKLWCKEDIAEGEELFLRYSVMYPRDYTL